MSAVTRRPRAAVTGLACSSRNLGFTLIEVLMVMAMIAILAAIALPNYQEYVRRGYRAEAREALQQSATWMERVATATGTYPATDAFPAALKRVGSGLYTISLESSDGAQWTLTATRVSGKGQANDKCGNFTLKHSGERGLANQKTGVSVLDCWDR